MALKFFVVKYGRGLVQVFKLEIGGKLVKGVHVLSVLVAASKKSDVVYDSLRKISPRAEFVERCRTMAF